MRLAKNILRLTLAGAVLASLSACSVAPAYPVAYRATPVYVESYPVYRPAYSGGYYESDRRHYDYRGGRYYRDERRYQEPRRVESPFEAAADAHRDIRRSLGLPRLPGMP